MCACLGSHGDGHGVGELVDALNEQSARLPPKLELLGGIASGHLADNARLQRAAGNGRQAVHLAEIPSISECPLHDFAKREILISEITRWLREKNATDSGLDRQKARETVSLTEQHMQPQPASERDAAEGERAARHVASAADVAHNRAKRQAPLAIILPDLRDEATTTNNTATQRVLIMHVGPPRETCIDITDC